jgi:hypothetical protein
MGQDQSNFESRLRAVIAVCASLHPLSTRCNLACVEHSIKSSSPLLGQATSVNSGCSSALVSSITGCSFSSRRNDPHPQLVDPCHLVWRLASSSTSLSLGDFVSQTIHDTPCQMALPSSTFRTSDCRFKLYAAFQHFGQVLDPEME